MDFGAKVMAFGLPQEDIGKLASLFVRSAAPINSKSSTRRQHDINVDGCTLDAVTVERPTVVKWGDIIAKMVGYSTQDIPPQALSFAFEMHAGPENTDPGILIRGLMQRFERCRGVGDAMRDATTSAKVNGGVTNFAWDKYIRPFFSKVQHMLMFTEDLTELGAHASARREGMVPYMQFATWPIPPSIEYPTGRSILITQIRPQLEELVRSYCGLDQILGDKFFHNDSGAATDVRQQVQIDISFICDATVIGKSRLGNKNHILHHTRGGFKLIVNGRESRSPYSIEEVVLMTGNDHFLEVLVCMSKFIYVRHVSHLSPSSLTGVPSCCQPTES